MAFKKADLTQFHDYLTLKDFLVEAYKEIDRVTAAEQHYHARCDVFDMTVDALEIKRCDECGLRWHRAAGFFDKCPQCFRRNGGGHVNKSTEVRCNRCGISCWETVPPARPGEEPLGDNYGLIDCKVRGYYLSPVLEDCTEYTFHICEGCLSDMFRHFTIPVVLRNYRIGMD